jgi:hypothetical protein
MIRDRDRVMATPDSWVPPGLPAGSTAVPPDAAWLAAPGHPLSVLLSDGTGPSRPARHARALRLLTVAQGWATVNREEKKGE